MYKSIKKNGIEKEKFINRVINWLKFTSDEARQREREREDDTSRHAVAQLRNRNKVVSLYFYFASSSTETSNAFINLKSRLKFLYINFYVFFLF